MYPDASPRGREIEHAFDLQYHLKNLAHTFAALGI